MTQDRKSCLNPLIYGAWFWLALACHHLRVPSLNPLIYGAWFWPSGATVTASEIES